MNIDVQSWSARWEQHGPRFVSLLLLLWLLLGAAAEVARVSGPHSAGNLGRLSATANAGDAGRGLREVLAAHLFGSAPADPASAPPTTEPLTLQGTLANNDPALGLAIISAGGPSRLYKVGGNISGATLQGVYVDHVILDRGGSLETLSLPRRYSMGAAPAPVVAFEAAGTVAAGAASGPLSSIIRFSGPMTQGGRLLGFKVFAGRNRSAFFAAGLHGGDVVTAVNGVSVTSQDAQAGERLLASVGEQFNATLTVDRRGQSFDIPVSAAGMAGTNSSAPVDPPANGS